MTIERLAFFSAVSSHPQVKMKEEYCTLHSIRAHVTFGLRTQCQIRYRGRNLLELNAGVTNVILIRHGKYGKQVIIFRLGLAVAPHVASLSHHAALSLFALGGNSYMKNQKSNRN